MTNFACFELGIFLIRCRTGPRIYLGPNPGFFGSQQQLQKKNIQLWNLGLVDVEKRIGKEKKGEETEGWWWDGVGGCWLTPDSESLVCLRKNNCSSGVLTEKLERIRSQLRYIGFVWPVYMWNPLKPSFNLNCPCLFNSLDTNSHLMFPYSCSHMIWAMLLWVFQRLKC